VEYFCWPPVLVFESESFIDFGDFLYSLQISACLCIFVECKRLQVLACGLFSLFYKHYRVLVFPGSGQMLSEIVENFPVELARCVKILLNIEACKF